MGEQGWLIHALFPHRLSSKGGAIVYRVALWYPDLVTCIFAICTPYLAPSKSFTPLETLVQTKLPNFGYQIQLASGEVEKKIQSKEEIKQFLNALYGGQGPNGEVGFDIHKGLLFEVSVFTVSPAVLFRSGRLAQVSQMVKEARKLPGVPVSNACLYDLDLYLALTSLTRIFQLKIKAQRDSHTRRTCRSCKRQDC